MTASPSHPSPSAVLITPFFLLGLLSALSHAATIELDFNDPAIPGDQVAFSSYTEDGFTIAPIGPIITVPPFELRRNGGGGSGFPDSGNAYIQLLFGDSFVLASNTNIPFTPNSIDLAEYSETFAGVITITFTGYFDGGGSVSTNFTTDGIIDGTGPLTDFETFFFPSSFTLISRLEVAQIDDPANAFSLDNIILDAVPEPTSLLLFISSSLLLLRRRR